MSSATFLLDAVTDPWFDTDMTTNAALAARKTALMGSATTPTLVAALLKIEGIAPRTADMSTARRFILEELEARYPQVNGPLDAWADSADTEFTYAQVLIAALPIEALS